MEIERSKLLEGEMTVEIMRLADALSQPRNSTALAHLSISLPD